MHYGKVTGIMQHITSAFRVTANLWILNSFQSFLQLWFEQLLIGCAFPCLSSCSACLQPVITRYVTVCLAHPGCGSERSAMGAHGWFSSHKLQAIPDNFAWYPIRLLWLDEKHPNPLSKRPCIASPLLFLGLCASTGREPCTSLPCPGTRHPHPQVRPKSCWHKSIQGYFFYKPVTFAHSTAYLYRSALQLNDIWCKRSLHLEPFSV